jgi:hypothetical protein
LRSDQTRRAGSGANFPLVMLIEIIHGDIFSDYRGSFVLNGYKMNFPLFPVRMIFAPTFLMAAFSHRTEPALLVYQTK